MLYYLIKDTEGWGGRYYCSSFKVPIAQGECGLQGEVRAQLQFYH